MGSIITEEDSDQDSQFGIAQELDRKEVDVEENGELVFHRPSEGMFQYMFVFSYDDIRQFE